MIQFNMPRKFGFPLSSIIYVWTGFKYACVTFVEMAEREMQIFAYYWIWLSVWQMIFTGIYNHLNFDSAHSLSKRWEEGIPYMLKHNKTNTTIEQKNIV